MATHSARRRWRHAVLPLVGAARESAGRRAEPAGERHRRSRNPASRRSSAARRRRIGRLPEVQGRARPERSRTHALDRRSGPIRPGKKPYPSPQRQAGYREDDGPVARHRSPGGRAHPLPHLVARPQEAGRRAVRLVRGALRPRRRFRLRDVPGRNLRRRRAEACADGESIPARQADRQTQPQATRPLGETTRRPLRRTSFLSLRSSRSGNRHEWKPDADPAVERQGVQTTQGRHGRHRSGAREGSATGGRPPPRRNPGCVPGTRRGDEGRKAASLGPSPGWIRGLRPLRGGRGSGPHSPRDIGGRRTLPGDREDESAKPVALAHDGGRRRPDRASDRLPMERPEQPPVEAGR